MSQIYRLSYPGGEARRLTNDLNGYDGLSLASAGRSIAAMRRTDVSNVWVAPADGGKEAHPITFATGPSGSSGEPLPLPEGNVVLTVSEGDKALLWRVAESSSERHKLVAQGLVSFLADYAEKAGIVSRRSRTRTSSLTFGASIPMAGDSGSSPRVRGRSW